MAGKRESVCAPAPPPIVRSGRSAWPLPAGYQAVRKRAPGDSIVEVVAPGGLAKVVHFVSLAAADQIVEPERRQLERLVAFRHPYFVSIERLEVRDDHLAVVTEPTDAGLHTLDMTSLTRAAVLALLEEAAEVLDLLNLEHAYPHLDIRPDNLHVSGGHIKVGLPLLDPLRRRPGTAANERPSTFWAAPELRDGTVHPRSDQFSLAVVTAQLLSGAPLGRPIRASDSNAEAGSAAARRDALRSALSLLADQDRSVLERALAPDPAARFESCRQFTEALAPVRARPSAVVHSAWEPQPAAEVPSRDDANRRRPETVRVDVEAAIPGLDKQTAAMTTTYVTSGTPDVHLGRLESFAGQCKARLLSLSHNSAVLTFRAHTGWLRRLCGKSDLLLVRLRFFHHDQSPPGSLVEIAVSYPGKKIGRDGFGRYCEQIVQLLKRCFTESDQSGQHVRSQARLRIRRTVLIRPSAADSNEVVCIAVDVSSTGLGVVSPTPIPAGEVSVRMPGDEQATAARVVRCVPQDRSSFRLGLSFLAETKLPERLLDGLSSDV